MATASICIPARNGAQGIEYALESALRQTFSGSYDIHVFVNASTDQTAQKVQMVQKRNPSRDIYLYESKTPGIGNAVTELLKRSTSNSAIFMDEDVVLDPMALERIYTHLTAKKLSLVGGRPSPVFEGTSLLTQWITIPEPRQVDLCGRLYALNREYILRDLNKYGFDKIPDVIYVDHFLLGIASAWDICQDAVVHFRPYEWFERADQEVRHLRGRAQIRSLSIDRDKKLPETKLQKFDRKYGYAFKAPSMLTRLFLGSGILGGTVLKRYQRYRARRIMQTEETAIGTTKFEVASETKKIAQVFSKVYGPL